MTHRLRTQAIVLRRSDLGESDRLVTLLAPRLGLFKAVAPGARRSKRRFAGCLELFSRIEVSLVDKGPGKLGRLEEAVLHDAQESIKADPVSIGHAGYAAELVMAFLGEGDDTSNNWDLLLRVFERLGKGPLTNAELRRLELEILASAGLAPRFGECVSCGTRQTERWYFTGESGGLVCASCAAGSAQSMEITQECIAFLAGLQADDIPSAVGATIMNPARDLLARIIDIHVGRPLKSREFLRQLAGR